jgi:hypothetical protein
VNAQNQWEQRARDIKLAKLLDASDEIVKALGFNPRRHAQQVAAFWRDATVEQFAALYKLAKVIAPSQHTLEQFFEALQHRADVRAS